MSLTVQRKLSTTSVVSGDPVFQINAKGGLSVKVSIKNDTNYMKLVISDCEMMEASLKYVYKGEMKEGVSEGVFLTSEGYPSFTPYKAGGDRAQVAINIYVNALTIHPNSKLENEIVMVKKEEVNYPLMYALYKHAICFLEDDQKVVAYDISKEQVIKMMRNLHDRLFPEVSWEEVEWPTVARAVLDKFNYF